MNSITISQQKKRIKNILQTLEKPSNYADGPNQAEDKFFSEKLLEKRNQLEAQRLQKKVEEER